MFTQTVRKTDRDTEKRRDRGTERQANWQINRQKDKQTDISILLQMLIKNKYSLWSLPRLLLSIIYNFGWNKAKIPSKTIGNGYKNYERETRNQLSRGQLSTSFWGKFCLLWRPFRSKVLCVVLTCKLSSFSFLCVSFSLIFLSLYSSTRFASLPGYDKAK